MTAERTFVGWGRHKLLWECIHKVAGPILFAWAVDLFFFLLSFEHCLLLFPLLLCLLLEDSFVLHEDYLLHQDTFVGVNHTVDSFVVLWELPDSFSLHIQGDVCALKVILILVVELWSLLHCSDHHWVRDEVQLLFWLATRLYRLFQLFVRLCSGANDPSWWWQLAISTAWTGVSLRYLTRLLLDGSGWLFLMYNLRRFWCNIDQSIDWESRHNIWCLVAASWVRPWLRSIALSWHIVIRQFQLRPVSLVIDRLRSLVSRLNEEYLFNAHVVWINIVLANIFVKVEHLFDSLVQLVLVSETDVLSRVFQVDDLVLNLI